MATAAQFNGWTQDRIDILEKTWADGLSASQIASRLGGVSRNAVIGKVHRLGLARRAETPSHRKTSDRGIMIRQPRTKSSEFFVVTGRLKPRKLAKIEAPKPRILDRVVARLAVHPNLPESLRISLLDLTERMCKFPCGHPGEEGFGFCGHPRAAGVPYCDHHAERTLISGRRKF